jgi:hypothetical protein
MSYFKEKYDAGYSAKHNERVECSTCGKTYTRCNKLKHNATSHHIKMEKMKTANKTLYDMNIAYIKGNLPY